MSNKRRLFAALFAVGLLLGWRAFASRNSEPDFDVKIVERNEKSARIAARAQNEFGLKLLRVTASQKPGENTFLSPTSVWMALAMAKNGAGGTSKTELKRVLELKDDDSAPTIALSAILKAQGAKINLANAIWADKTTPFAPAFIKFSASDFGASAQSLDFKAPGSVGVINDWVEKQTDGKISDLIEKLPSSGAVLTNALYFRGRWQTPFEKDLTQDAPFHMPDATKKTVPLMAAEGFKLIEGKNFDGAIMPYANSSCELVALLPQKGVSPSAVVAGLDAATLAAMEANGETAVRFPRFSLDWEDSLGAPLQTLGLQAIFISQTADLRPMGMPPLSFVSEVRHKTRLEIDEQGTVATAATEVETNTSSATTEEPKTLTFDRPFVLLLRENRSGALLFAGIINDPQTKP